MTPAQYQQSCVRTLNKYVRDYSKQEILFVWNALALADEFLEFLSADSNTTLNDRTRYITEELGACWYYLIVLFYVCDVPLPNTFEHDKFQACCSTVEAVQGITDAAKKMVFYGRGMNKVRIEVLLTVCFHCFVRQCNMLRIDVQKVLQLNKEKLEQRYPFGWIEGQTK